MSTDDRKPRIEAALRRHLGAGCALTELTVLTGGASSTTYRLGVTTAAGTRGLVLRCASAREGFAMNVSKTVEARVQAAARAAGVPAAAVVFELDADDELGEGYAMELVLGETSPARFLGDAALRARLASHAGEVLARIHRVPTAGLPTLTSETPSEQLGALREAYDTYQQPSPVFEASFRWLAEHLPTPRPAGLVHGDFRTGNLLVGPDGIRAVLDWELCHLGDPIEDLGWCCVAAWRFGRLSDRVGGFGSVAALRTAYVSAGGVPFGDDDLRFWEVYGTLRWGVICLYQVFAHLRGEIPSIERAAIGRRVSEVELDLLRLVP